MIIQITFLSSPCINPNETDDTLETLELDFFLGKNYLVTCYTDDFMPPIANTWKLIIRITDYQERLIFYAIQ
jgi:hypothetical protein